MATPVSDFDRQGEDWYVEPRWIWDALFKVEEFPDRAVYDPACGQGTVLEAAFAAGLIGTGGDIVRRRGDRHVNIRDFLGAEQAGAHYANIVTNPPFKHADAFVKRALYVARHKVAMLLPATWAHSVTKGRPWLPETPLYRVYAIAPRPSLLPGDSTLKPGGGVADFSVYVWLKGHRGPSTFGWLRRDDERAATA